MEDTDDLKLFDDDPESFDASLLDDDCASGLTGAIAGLGKQSEQELNNLIGKLLNDQFLIETRIGSGGAGTVFLATDNKTDRKVAIKVLSKAASKDPANFRRFGQETRVTRYLKNKYIVRVYEYGEEDGHPFFVMDYLSGGSLKDKLEGGPLGAIETVKVLKQVCEAIGFAHKQGVIHRDIKPNNIMFVDETLEEIRLLDFGVSKTTTWDIDQKVAETDGELFGTPLYFAPERANGKEANECSDVYSLGCVIYECLTGQPPHTGSNSVEIFMRHQTKPIVAVSKTSGGSRCPRGLEHIVMKMLMRRPKERYQSISDVLSDITKYEQGDTFMKLSQAVGENNLFEEEAKTKTLKDQSPRKIDELEAQFRQKRTIPQMLKEGDLLGVGATILGISSAADGTSSATSSAAMSSAASDTKQQLIEPNTTPKLKFGKTILWFGGVTIFVGVVFLLTGIARTAVADDVEGLTYYYKPATKTKPGSIYLWVADPDEVTPGKLEKIEIPVNFNLDDQSGNATGTQVGDLWRLHCRHSGEKKILEEAEWAEEQAVGEDLRQIDVWIREMFGLLAKDGTVDQESFAAFYMPDWSADDYKKVKDTWSRDNLTFKVVSESSRAPKFYIKVESYDRDQGKAIVLVKTNFWIQAGPLYMRFILVKKDNRKWLIAKVEEVSPSIWESDGVVNEEPAEEEEEPAEDE